jgi:hypothetical protein
VLVSVKELVIGSVLKVGEVVGSGVGAMAGARVDPPFLPEPPSALLAIYLLAIARINSNSLFAIERNLLARASIVFQTNIIIMMMMLRILFFKCYCG